MRDPVAGLVGAYRQVLTRINIFWFDEYYWEDRPRYYAALQQCGRR